MYVQKNVASLFNYYNVPFFFKGEFGKFEFFGFSSNFIGFLFFAEYSSILIIDVPFTKNTYFISKRSLKVQK